MSRPETSRFDARFLGVLACFLLSGFAGLLYQTAWTRQFSFVFGTSSLAVATVLAAYMGGMAGGAAIAARFVDRIRRPLLTYGLLEGGIALSALAVPYAVSAAGVLRSVWLSSEGIPDEGGTGAAVFYLIVSFVVLFIPTGLMGATLPLLTRYAVREQEQVGSRIGALYSINTAGAVGGVLTTAFFLLPRFGLASTIWVGVAMNGIVLGVAWLLATSSEGAEATPTEPSELAPLRPRAASFLAIAFGAGIASFTFEVLWTRLFEHVLGASVYAFATMLASFLIGIALGAAVASRIARNPTWASHALPFSLVGAAVFSLLAYHQAQMLPDFAAGLDPTKPLERLLRLSVYCGALLLPSTLCIGATFPFIVRVIVGRPEASAAASARVYAWNTLGAILGAVGAGFVIIPWLGFEGTLRATVAGELALALIAALLVLPVARPGVVAALLGGICLVALPPTPPWALLQSRPIASPSKGAERPEETVYYGVGKGSTVLMTRDDNTFRLWTNGLPEAFIGRIGERPGNGLTARWLGALPALQPGGAERMLVIGLGGGVALEGLPASLQHIDVIELEPEVATANREVGALRSEDPLADPRIHLVINDARGALQLTQSSWDAIVSQPSHPWTAGASHLYTHEFLELVKSRLEPGGVFVQWIGLGFIDPPLLRNLAATMLGSFSNVRAYDLGGLLFLASNSPLPTRAQELAEVALEPDVFARLGVLSAEDLAAMQILDEGGVRSLAADAPMIYDDDNLLATRSPLLDRAASRRAIRELLLQRDVVASKLDGLDPIYLTRRLQQRGQKARAAQLADALPNLAQRLAARGIVERAAGRPRNSFRAFRQALNADPNLVYPRFRLTELAEAKGGQEQDARSGLTEPERAILDGIRLRHQERYADLAALDDQLRAVDLRHPGKQAARELQVAWRLADGRTRAAEALKLIEGDAYGWGPGRHAQRAYATALLGQHEAARTSLRELAASRLRRGKATGRNAKHALAALALVPAEMISPDERSSLRKTFGRFAPGPTASQEPEP